MYRTETVVIRYITLRFILSGIFAVVVRIPHPFQSFADRVKEVIVVGPSDVRVFKRTVLPGATLGLCNSKVYWTGLTNDCPSQHSGSGFRTFAGSCQVADKD